MRLNWLDVRDFRNHRELSVSVPEGLTAVVGPNGRGKTNLLEAVYYLCALESPRSATDLPLVRWGASSAVLRGEIEAASGRLLVEVEVRAGGQNVARVNRAPVRRKRDLRRVVRAVYSGPEDLPVVLGDPAERRRFLDEAVRALWPPRDALAARYERVVRQRNRLLKEWDGPGAPPDLPAWDEELVATGSALIEARREAVEAIRDGASEEFQALSGGGAEALSVAYRPSVDGSPPAPSFRQRRAERRGDELVRRSTLVGPHRDDLAVVVEGLAARGFASHGEAWGAAVSLRLALASAVAVLAGETPLTLLDDPCSGLDPARRRRLAAGLAGRGQVLLAVPDEDHVPDGACVWRVGEEGLVA